jgi:hypothetical protein
MEARAFLELMEARDGLAPMSEAMLALTAHYFGFDEDASIILRNLSNSVSEENGILSGGVDARGRPLALPVAYWGRSSGYFFWGDGAVESTAWVLSALLQIDPDNKWIDPAVTWLCRNRTGTHWSNTRATGWAVLAITDYLRQRDRLVKGAKFAVTLDDELIELTSEDWMPAVVKLPDTFLNSEKPVAIQRVDREQPFNFELYADFYDTSERLEASSSDLAVSRSYVHLKPVQTLLEGVSEVMTPLDDGAVIYSGDRVEVVLRIEVPRDLNYVLVEDPKPAGFEAVQILSGPEARAHRVSGPDSTTSDAVFGYQELRDRHVGFLFDRLPAGAWEIRYRLRAESPGYFSAQPARAEPMYLNHVFGNSDEWRLEVGDAR